MMIEVNLLVTKDKTLPIFDKGTTIIAEYGTHSGNKLFVVNITEEEFTFFKLKYGSENVWKR